MNENQITFSDEGVSDHKNTTTQNTLKLCAPKRIDAAETMKFIEEFSRKINGMFLTNSDTDALYEISISLIIEYKRLAFDLLKNHEGSEAIAFASDFLTEHIKSKSRSTYIRQQELKRNDMFVEPEERVLGLHWEMKGQRKIHSNVPRLLPSKMHYIPILKTLESLFRQKDFREMYLDYNSGPNRHKCIPGIYEDFCCGSVYNVNELFSNHTDALQLQIGTDDFELCNPIESKATIHKIFPIYFTIKNLPKHYASKVSNIHVISLCRCDDLKTLETDVNDIWKMVVDELSVLEDKGILIDGNRNIKGTTAYLGHDNLGANTVLGFSGSFSARYYCRFCLVSKNEAINLCSEDASKLRTIQNYEECLHTVKKSTYVDLKETYGVKQSCVLNELNFFHVITNRSVDIMHDLCEGIILFCLKKMFKYLIKQKKIFSGGDIQKKIQFFDFGSHQRNAPSRIALEKENLNQNATQLLCLFRHIGFIFFDYRDNDDFKHIGKCVEALHRIVQISYSPKIHERDIQYLQESIIEHLSSLKKLFNVNLTPKHHIVTHYPGIIRSMGPICFMSMLRFEAKHKSLKNTVKKTNNFVNITKTLSVRHQAELCYRGYTYGDYSAHGKIQTLKFDKLVEKESLAIKKITTEDDSIYWIEHMSLNMLKYVPGVAILYKNSFRRIIKILVINDQYHFLTDKLKYKSFDTFTHSLIVEEEKHFEVISFMKLDNKRPYELKSMKNALYIYADTLEINAAITIV